jgi:hypothetical protein
LVLRDLIKISPPSCKFDGILDQIPEELLKTREVTQKARVAGGQTKNRAERPDRYPLSKPRQKP